MKKTAFLLLYLFVALTCGAQSRRPNFSSKSHPTMFIEGIQKVLKMTVVNVSIKNELSEGAWFCADKNIVLNDPLTGKSYPLTRAENIPVCPQQHHFTRKGEILKFKLYFPELPAGTKYVDLIEKCEQACFYVKGIILSEGFNAQVEMAYLLYSKGKGQESAEAFSELIQSHQDYPYGIFYFQTIKIWHELKNKEKAKSWIKQFKNKGCLDQAMFMEMIRENRYGD